MEARDIIVIGASAGGVEALTSLCRKFPKNLPAAVFMVIHLPATMPSALPHILGRAGALPAHHPWNGERIRRGHIYVAPPDYHILLNDGLIRLSNVGDAVRPTAARDALVRALPGAAVTVMAGPRARSLR